MLAVAPIVPCRKRILDALGVDGAPRPPPSLENPLAAAPLFAIGGTAGVLAGLFGVGGGAVVVPLLALAPARADL